MMSFQLKKIMTTLNSCIIGIYKRDKVDFKSMHNRALKNTLFLKNTVSQIKLAIFFFAYY